MATPTTLPATFVAGNVLTAAQMNNLRGAFRILQVVQTVKTDTFTTNSLSFVDVTGLNVTITPSSTSSKILVMAQVTYCLGNSSGGMIKIIGGNAGNYIGDVSGSRVRAILGGQNAATNQDVILTGVGIYLDSPATTSATTYKVQAIRSLTAGAQFHINFDQSGFADANHTAGASSITVMEISA
jgi:hypothetical protein